KIKQSNFTNGLKKSPPMADNFQDFLFFLQYLREEDDIDQRLDSILCFLNRPEKELTFLDPKALKFLRNELREIFELDLQFRNTSKFVLHYLRPKMNSSDFEKELLVKELNVIKFRYSMFYDIENKIRQAPNSKRDVDNAMNIYISALKIIKDYLKLNTDEKIIRDYLKLNLNEKDLDNFFSEFEKEQFCDQFLTYYAWEDWAVHLTAKGDWLCYIEFLKQDIDGLEEIGLADVDVHNLYWYSTWPIFLDLITAEVGRYQAWEKMMLLENIRQCLFKEFEEMDFSI
ncbi:43862_t:CDS:2, partial [Gigaspora margarita]